MHAPDCVPRSATLALPPPAQLLLPHLAAAMHPRRALPCRSLIDGSWRRADPGHSSFGGNGYIVNGIHGRTGRVVWTFGWVTFNVRPDPGLPSPGRLRSAAHVPANQAGCIRPPTASPALPTCHCRVR